MYHRVLNLSSAQTDNNILSLSQNQKQTKPKMEIQIPQKSNSNSNPHDQIVVATLNYGGILNSPFEFYSNEQKEEIILSQIFKALLPQYFKDFDEKTFSWAIGKIDQKIQKERYTPIYNPNAGIQDGKLISAQRFEQKWKESFQAALPKAKLQKLPTKDETQTMKTFDLICYHALLRHAYSIKSITEVQNKDATEYKHLLGKFFSRSYLDQNKKLQKVIKLIQDQEPIVNVFFFQQPTEALTRCIKQLGQFVVIAGQKDQSIIAVRNNPNIWNSIRTFEEMKVVGKLTQQQCEKIEANKETRIVFCDKIIFICIHLSSKEAKNKKQLWQLKQGIRILKQKFFDHHFVIGGDTNRFLQQRDIRNENEQNTIHVYPNDKNQITTCKKRTFMQPQFNKADSVNAECKDQLMSTLKMDHVDVLTISKEKGTGDLNLPTEKHPSDHFLVIGVFKKSINAY